MSKKLLAILMTLMLVLSVLPMAISAEESACEHTNAEWFSNLSEHLGRCSDCEEWIGEWEPHTMENGVCTGCGIKLCADGNHALESDEYGKMHFCANCDFYVWCGDNNGDCKCDVCGAESHDYWSHESNDTQHWTLCDQCGEEGAKEDHHDSDGVGGCDTCGYGCAHGNIVWNGYLEYHYGWCEDCHEYFTGDEPHTMENGVCTVCGFKLCADGNHALETDEYGYHTCKNCDFFVRCGTDEDENCKCDICGTDAHFYSEYGHNDTQHWDLCDKCGEERAKEDHHDSDGVGGCDTCGYGCAHGDFDWIWYLEDHYGWCYDCRNIVAGAHTFVNGTCSVCGWTPCANGEHNVVEGEYSGHHCQDCGVYIECSDKDGNCQCDLCGAECHEAVIETTSTQHRAYCKNCDAKTDWLDHMDENDDKVCDACDYKLSGTGTGSGGGNLDDVPATGDVTGVLMAVSASFACAAAFVSLKKRR